MNTTISTKLAALALALMINTFLLGSVAFLFNVQLQQGVAGVALAATDIVVAAKAA